MSDQVKAVEVPDVQIGDIYASGMWTATFKTLAENEDIFDKESKFRGLTVYSEIDRDGVLRDPRIIPKDAFDDFLKIFTEQNCVTRKYKAVCINDRRMTLGRSEKE